MEAQDGQADDAEQHVEDDDGAAHVVLVAEGGAGKHDDAGKDVWGSDEALRRADVKAEAEVEDDGHEVGQRVGDGGRVEEDEGVHPDLDIGAAAQPLLPAERLSLDVSTVGVNLGDNPCPLAFAQEAPVGSCRVGEIDEQPVAGNTEETGNDTLDNENPTPSTLRNAG